MSQKIGNNSGRFYGKYRGIVSNIKDPEFMGRIKFTCPDVFGSDKIESAWALPCVTFAYEGGGDLALPPIGETLWVEFEQGNPNKPIWTGNFWTKQKTPLGAGGLYGTARVISYGGSIITLSGGSVSINGSVTIGGNLKVSGTVSAKNI